MQTATALSAGNPNPKERCAACGMPRDAHWGPRPICAGRCTGFESSATERVRAAAPAMLAVLKTTRGNIVSLRDAGLPGPLKEWLRVVDEAIANAEAV